ADALLRLQHRGGHDINLILFGLWLGFCEGARLDAAGVRRAERAIGALSRDVVTPLRAMRRALQDNPDADARDIGRRVLALEIAAERRVQARLAATVALRRAPASDRYAAAVANLRRVAGADAASEDAAAVMQALQS